MKSFVIFSVLGQNYGVDIEEERAERIKVDWRKANPKIVKLWYNRGSFDSVLKISENQTINRIQRCV